MTSGIVCKHKKMKWMSGYEVLDDEGKNATCCFEWMWYWGWVTHLWPNENKRHENKQSMRGESCLPSALLAVTCNPPHLRTFLTPACITNEMPTSIITAGASTYSIVGISITLCVGVQCWRWGYCMVRIFWILIDCWYLCPSKNPPLGCLAYIAGNFCGCDCKGSGW